MLNLNIENNLCMMSLVFFFCQISHPFLDNMHQVQMIFIDTLLPSWETYSKEETQIMQIFVIKIKHCGLQKHICLKILILLLPCHVS